jgi:hypothetical protein
MRSIFTIIFSMLLIFSQFLWAQTEYTQFGSSINGASEDNLGIALSSSADGNIIATTSLTSTMQGKVTVYQFSGSTWVQRGAVLNGENAMDNFGKGLSMNDDGSVIAIGAPNFGENAGRVYLYEWDGSSYVQLQVLTSGAANESFGDAVSLSASGDYLAVGSPGGSEGKMGGIARVYLRSGNNWEMIGNEILGINDFEGFGASVSLAITDSDKVLAVGAPDKTVDGGDYAGEVRIYRSSTGSWGGTWAGPEVLKGGENDNFGKAVSLSADGLRLAVGAPKFFFDPVNAYIQMFTYDEVGESWSSLGSSVVSNIDADEFGGAIAISKDGSHVIAGASSSEIGYIKLFEFDEDTTDWLLLESIEGSAEYDFFGTSVAINEDGSKFFVGASSNAGQVKAYKVFVPDTTPPTVVLSFAGGESSAESPFSITITFDEEVEGFEASDLTIENGEVNSIGTTDNIVFTATITPESAGEVTIQLLADAVTDLAGNGNVASNELVILFSPVRPEVVILPDGGKTLFNAPFNVTITFTKEMQNFVATDINVTNGSVSNLSTEDNKIFTGLITPVNNGEVIINIAEGVAQTSQGGANLAAEEVKAIFDNIPPSAVFKDVPTSIMASGAIITLEFSEEVPGFDKGDITINNATIGEFNTAEVPNTYTVQILPVEGLKHGALITITLAPGSLKDEAGNSNTDAFSAQTTFKDTTPPTVVLSFAGGESTAESPFSIAITFDEEVEGFAASDLTIENGVVNSITTTDNIVFTATITPESPGEVTIQLLANAVTDLGGNGNLASNELVILFSPVKPEVVIVLEEAKTIYNASFKIFIGFTMDVQNFEAADISVTNGSVSNFTPLDKKTFSVLITPVNNGEVIINIAEGVAQSSQGAGNLAAEEVKVIFDNIPPSVVFKNVPTSTMATGAAITLEFSEEVQGFGKEAFTVTNAVVGQVNAAAAANTFTAQILPAAGSKNGALITVSLAVGSFKDLAGNFNKDAFSTQITFQGKYSGGAGTEADPYLIGTEADLRAISGNTGDYSAHFRQIADINVSAEAITPIGRGGSPFKGVYDGKGFHIKGIRNFNTVEFSTFTIVKLSGLFGLTEGATMKNIGIVSLDITNSQALYMGSLVSILDRSTIENCYATGRITGNIKAVTGGLIGYTTDSDVLESFSDVVITVVLLDNEDGFNGGLLGQVLGGKVINSYSKSNLNILYQKGEFFELAAGGLTGYVSSITEIKNSYYAGVITTESSGNFGGIAGKINPSNNQLTVTNSFWDTALSGVDKTADGKGTGLNSLLMRNPATYQNAGWDIGSGPTDLSKTWAPILFNYPALSWQMKNIRPFDFSGRVLNENGQPFTQGQVSAMGSNSFVTVPIGSNGEFSFKDLPGVTHSIYVTPNNGDQYFTTYYGDTQNMFAGKLAFYHNAGQTIRMIRKSQANLLDGNGRISGNVVRNNGNARMIQGAKLAGDPLAGISVTLLRVSDQQIMTTVVTDEKGEFKIEGIPAGAFQLIISIGGIDLNLEGSTFTIDATGTPLIVSAAVSEDGIQYSFEVEEVLGVQDQKIEIAIYPNPATSYINIMVKGKSQLRLMDMHGRLIIEKSFVDEIRLDVENLKNNMYILEINNSQGKAIRKLIKK